MEAVGQLCSGCRWGDVVDLLFDSLCEKLSGVWGSSLSFGFGGPPLRCFGGGCGVGVGGSFVDLGVFAVGSSFREFRGELNVNYWGT